MKRFNKVLQKYYAYLSCVLHLLVEADDRLRVNELFGHHEVETCDFVELIEALFAVQAANAVV